MSGHQPQESVTLRDCLRAYVRQVNDGLRFNPLQTIAYCIAAHLACLAGVTGVAWLFLLGMHFATVAGAVCIASLLALVIHVFLGAWVFSGVEAHEGGTQHANDR